MRIVRSLPLTLVFALAVVGCDQNQVNRGGVELENPKRRIVSLTPGTTEIVLLGGGASYLRARGTSDNYPHFVSNYPAVVGQDAKPNYEKIAELKPDLIVYDEDLFNESDVDKLKQLGVETFAFGGDTVDAYVDNLYALAKTYGGEVDVSTYVDKLERARRAAEADPVTPTPKVAILMPGSSSEHWIAGTKSFQADLVRNATGEPIGPEVEQFVAVNAEGLVKLNPDVIITSGDPTPVVKDPRLQSVSAVKNNRVVGIKPDLLLRRGWRVPETIEAIYKILGETNR